MTLDDAKNLGQITAWFAAAVFFGYKIVSGYFIGSASLRLSCNRAPAKTNPGVDYVSVVAILKRSAGSTLELHDAKVRVTYASGQVLPDVRILPQNDRVPVPADTETRLIGTERLSSWTTPADVLQVKFDQLSGKKPHLNLAPGDEMQFAALYEVAQERACIVEVAVLGQSRGTTKRALWRASDISLPLPPKS